MKKSSGTLAFVFLFVFVCLSPLRAESVSLLLQKGIFAEETEGNLDAAIKIYQEIVAEAQANRTLIAQAQFRLASCLLKKGQRTEAATAFREIVDHHAAEPALVAKARSHLAELGQAGPGVLVKQIWAASEAGIEPASLRPSPDGRYVAWYDQQGGDLELRDLQTGLNRKLTHRGHNSLESAGQSAFSRDGRQIACSWLPNFFSETVELRIINVEDASQRVLCAQTNRAFLAEDWSPDGRSIVVVATTSSQEPFKYNISLISTMDGSERPIQSVTGTYPGRIRFSPDGRYLAYNTALYIPHHTNDIVIAELETGAQRVVSQRGLDEQFVDWAPGTNRILFTSNRRGSVDLWTAGIINGQADGQLALAKADVGDIVPRGMSRDGTLFYSTSVAMQDLHTATLNLESGQLLAGPRLVQVPTTGWNDKPVVSQDGTFLFFRCQHRVPRAFRLNLDTWEPMELTNSAAWSGRIWRWFPGPDSSTLLLSLYASLAESQGYYLLNVHTGARKPIALSTDDLFYLPIAAGPFDGKTVHLFRRYGSHQNPKRLTLVRYDLSSGRETENEAPAGPESGNPWQGPWLRPDLKTVFYNRKQATNDSYALVGRHLETGQEKEYFVSRKKVFFMINDAGDQVALSYEDDQNRHVAKFFSFATKELRETFTATAPEGFKPIWHLWKSPSVMLEKSRDEGTRAAREVWILSARTGELKRTGLTLAAHQTLGHLHEDRGRLLLRTVAPACQELWAMENLFTERSGH